MAIFGNDYPYLIDYLKLLPAENVIIDGEISAFRESGSWAGGVSAVAAVQGNKTSGLDYLALPGLGDRGRTINAAICACQHRALRTS